MARDPGIVVACDDQQVVGFVCAARCDSRSQPPIIKSMVGEFGRLSLQGRRLSSYRTFVYGPVCIDRSHRGRGLLRLLYDALKVEMAGKYEVGAGFVAEDNGHSLRAHVDGLGMDDVGRFEYGERGYRVVAFRVQEEEEA